MYTNTRGIGKLNRLSIAIEIILRGFANVFVSQIKLNYRSHIVLFT